MDPIGERLKRARLEKGLTLEDVHRKTKIHLNVLKAIEEGSLVNFSPVYIKGFLKIYCKFLGMEYSDGMTDRKQALPAVRPVQERQQASLAAIDTAAMFAGVSNFIRRNLRMVLCIVVILLAVIGLFKLGKFITLKARQLPKRAVIVKPVYRQPVKSEKKKETASAKPVKAEKPAVALPKPQASETAVLSGIRLGIRTKEDCWLQVKIDGKTIFRGSLKKGRFENWQAKEKIELSLGNAGVVELEVNGKFIPSLGRRGQAVKNILITKDGLTTSR